ncbi:MAG: hypothetical protein LBT53_00340 [Puniceicoccales bacterium]|jgi:GNAT superfamily N-acetyltransferase|nr:hypothetical protein [Puniceicoccales bacterium]
MQITTIPTSAYLAFLNEVFPHWGDAAVYDWVFGNNTENETSDIFALADADVILAGSGITYRTIGSAANFRITIGIMTGSWTLPAHRGKGCFTKIIEESFRRVKGKNYDALAAFVTQKNASAGRLNAAGSAMLPAYYIFSDTSAGAFSSGVSSGVSNGEWKPEIVSPDAAIFACLHDAHAHTGAADDIARFLYTPEAFRKQFVERPSKPFILSANGLLLVAEESSDAVKILFADKRDLPLWTETLRQLAFWAHKQKGKKIYYYTTLAAEKDLLEKTGFQTVPGFLTLLSNDKTRTTLLPPLDIQLGDKM